MILHEDRSPLAVYRRRRGFTLVEVLLAAAIFATIMAIVYGLFSSVEGGVAKIEAGQERIRVTDFLLREISRNLASAHQVASTGMGQAVDVSFVGEDIEEKGFAADSLRFVSLAPPLGGSVVPGGPKLISIMLEIPPDDALEELGLDDREEEPTYLNLREQQMLSMGVSEQDKKDDNLFDDEHEAIDDIFDEPRSGIKWTEDREQSGLGTEMVASTSLFDTEPVWSIEVQSFNAQYYDGVEWVDSWDSTWAEGGQQNLLPWAVRVEIDFPLAEGEDRSRSDILERDEDEHDFVAVVTLPASYGLWPEEAQLFRAPVSGVSGLPLAPATPGGGSKK